MELVQKSGEEKAKYLKKKGFMMKEAIATIRAGLFDIVYKILETNELTEDEFKKLHRNKLVWRAVVSAEPELWAFKPGNSVSWY